MELSTSARLAQQNDYNGREAQAKTLANIGGFLPVALDNINNERRLSEELPLTTRLRLETAHPDHH
jgi:hypothetical protein